MRGGARGGSRQAEALVFIQTYLSAYGFAPTLEEITGALCFASKSCAQRIVTKLERDGKIRRLPRQARGIELRETDDHHKPDCLCDDCAKRRYIAGLKLVQALKVDAPVVIWCATPTNFRPLSDSTRADLLGSHSRGPAAAPPRTALPSGGAR